MHTVNPVPALLAAVLMAMATPAIAQTKPESPAASSSAPASGADREASTIAHIDLVASNAMRGGLSKYFDEGQINMLHATAHQQAVAMVCPGFAVDPVRFNGEMALIYLDAQGKTKTLTPEEKAALEQKAAFGFGTIFGSQLAIAALDQKGYCEAAAEERRRAASGHHIWIAAK